MVTTLINGEQLVIYKTDKSLGYTPETNIIVISAMH